MRADEDQLKRWMTGGLSGDRTDHAALLTALAPLLRAFYARRLSQSHEIGDLVQETLIAIHVRRASYDCDRPFLPWLFAIARYKMIDHFRQSRQHDPMDGLEESLTVDAFEDAVNARLDIDRILETLPDKQAAAIRHTRLDGLSVREAADRGGISEPDIKTSVHRGLKALTARILGERR